MAKSVPALPTKRWVGKKRTTQLIKLAAMLMVRHYSKESFYFKVDLESASGNALKRSGKWC